MFKLLKFILLNAALSLQKERDLELAARIGQSLLKKNKALSERNELLEEQVEHIREEVSNECVLISASVFGGGNCVIMYVCDELNVLHAPPPSSSDVSRLLIGVSAAP